MVIKDTNSKVAAGHWLEHMHVNLGGMPRDASRTAFALLRSPWNCPRVDIVRYVPEPLNHAIVMMQRSVLRHVFGKRALLSARSAISDTALTAYAVQPDGTAINLMPNALKVLEDYIGIAKEDLAEHGLQWTYLSRQAQASLLTLYAACETAVHVMAGMYKKYEADIKSPHYVIHPQFRTAHKVMWFSRFWARQSTLSDYLIAQDRCGALKRAPSFDRNAPLFQSWVDWVLDKYLCLHNKYIPELLRTKHGSELKELRSRAELLCFLWLQSIDQQRDLAEISQIILADLPFAKVTHAKLQSAGFSTSEIGDLLTESKAQPPGDRFLTQSESLENLQVHSLNLKFAVQKYLQPFLRRAGSTIGKWFEKDYLLTYLQARLDQSRFLVQSGIENRNENYDADLVILDKETGIFYFCQVKHRAEVLQPFLRDELNEYSRNKAIRHGIEQLQSLRLQIDTSGVRDRLISKVGKMLVGNQPLGKRSRFLLIHTVENFDMCTSDGIAMYEWNTFRNLLQGLVMHGNCNLPGEWRYKTEGLDFADIESVQAHLMNVLDRMNKDLAPEQPTPAQLYDLLHRAELSLNCRTALWLNNWHIFNVGSATLRKPLL